MLEFTRELGRACSNLGVRPTFPAIAAGMDAGLAVAETAQEAEVVKQGAVFHKWPRRAQDCRRVRL